MLDDKILAMLGDKEAAERLTAAGVLLPCPFCGGEMIVSYDFFAINNAFGRKWVWTVVCRKCYATTGPCCSREKAIELSNTRAPILRPEQIKRLEEMA